MRSLATIVVLALVALGFGACGSGSDTPTTTASSTSSAGVATAPAEPGQPTPAEPAPPAPAPTPPPAPAEPAGIEFSWPGVEQGGSVPARFTCDGEDVSPPLAWSNLPASAVEVVIIAADRDKNNLTHWLAYAIPAATGALPEGLPKKKLVETPIALRQGQNDLGENGWSGPCPPKGEEHTYVFLFFALKASLDVPGGADRNAVEEALAPLVVGNAALEVRYRRG